MIANRRAPLGMPLLTSLPGISRSAGSAVVAAALLTSLAGCASSDSQGESTSTSATTSASATASTSATTSGSSTTQSTPAIVSAANAFLATLSSSEKDTVLFDQDDNEQKARWSNLPPGLFERQGLVTGDLSDETLNAFLALMKATLSTEGYTRVINAWTADDELAGDGGGSYGKQYYYLAIIGEPSETESWQWQFGGHHITVNATVHGDDLSLTPSFIGAQPETYTADGSTVTVLGDINDEAFALVNSLDSSAQKQAVLGDTSIDLVLGAGQDCKTIQSEGLAGSDMSSTQQAAFLKLINHYGGLANDEDAAGRAEQLKSDLAQTYLAWYGSTTAGSAAYFRITGPRIVIEYSPQSMGGDAANHIHGIYRDPTNEYGGTVCS
jgi:hypothetical protein